MQKMNTIWLKAAVMGGLWASFEIIVGSFLHNLHIPFSGTTLATFSVILMIAFMQVWKEKGLIWRAGIICGLMKSLSPSAVILGPMTGIMMEAILMDLFIFIFGANLLGYILAGTWALLSTILHKIASLFILYGNDVVTIYVNLFEFLKKQLGILYADPADLIIWIIMIYTSIGALAALAGYLLGRYAFRPQPDNPLNPVSIDPFAESWKNTDPGQVFRVILLFIHLLCVPGMLILLNRVGLGLLSVIPVGAYIIFLMVYYKGILGRLKKPFFWSQLLLMTLAAGFFWTPPGEDKGLTVSGFIIGLEMSLRAIMIISAFSAISVEIRNPRITGLLLKKGFGNTYAAVSLAFNSLPVMLDRSPGLKRFVRHPLRYFSKLFAEAQIWLRCYETHLKE